MPKELTLPGLLTYLEQVMAQFPDLRVGNNTQDDLRDAGLGAFAVFFTQSASFLARQSALKLHQGRCNAESVFGLQQVPSDNQIRNLLDPVSPTFLAAVYRQVFLALDVRARR